MSQDERPNPIVRQRDLEVVVEREKNEHNKTRALVVILAVPNVARAIPYVLGAFGVPHGWIPW